jgi:elongation factor 3
MVWKHPNLRVAYVAQHAFHHIENHLDMTPNQYIQWRYATGEDRESLDKVSRKVSSGMGRSRRSGGRRGLPLPRGAPPSWMPCPPSLPFRPFPCSSPLSPSPLCTPQLKEEEEKKMKEVKVVDGVKRVVEKLLGRRKLKRGYEYEVQWKGEMETSWLTRDRLEEMGFSKMLTDIDMKEAAAAGLLGKPLTAKNVEELLANLGLPAEFATHSQVRSGWRRRCATKRRLARPMRLLACFCCCPGCSLLTRVFDVQAWLQLWCLPHPTPLPLVHADPRPVWRPEGEAGAGCRHVAAAPHPGAG